MSAAIGTGNSPPARNRAESPDSAIRFGSANRRTKPFCSNAVTSASRLPWPLLMTLARMVANGPAVLLTSVPAVVKIGTPPVPGLACVIGFEVPGAPVLKPLVPLLLARKRLTPRSRPAVRLTSRKRTSSLSRENNGLPFDSDRETRSSMMPLMNHQRRDNAARLLMLFVSVGSPSGAAMANARVLDLATQNGLDDQELLSGLNYAAEQDWLKVGLKGLLLTKAGSCHHVHWEGCRLN